MAVKLKWPVAAGGGVGRPFKILPSLSSSSTSLLVKILIISIFTLQHYHHQLVDLSMNIDCQKHHQINIVILKVWFGLVWPGWLFNLIILVINEREVGGLVGRQPLKS